jgi:endogenous inhibitor of DNA gyrase (YacG/DUF329 family)
MLDQHISSTQTRSCEQCAATFIATRSDRRFCSDRCRLRHWRQLKSHIDSDDHASLHQELEQLRQEVAELRQVVAALRLALERRTC